MRTSHIDAFFCDWSRLPRTEYLRFIYHCIPDGDPRVAAAHLCAESSTAMWQRTGVDEDLRARYGAKVVVLEPLPDGKGFHLEIAHPHCNFGPRLPNLLVAAAGEGAFYCPGVRAIKLCDIHFPDEYLRHFAGPQFGLAGLRERFGVYDRPFFVGVVKPNIGLSPVDFAALADQAWAGGLDICKDDEMQADTEWSPLIERVQCVARVCPQDKGFIANITDEVDVMPTLAQSVAAAGAQVVMCNPMWTGMSAIRAVRNAVRIPIMGHFAGVAAVARPTEFGITSSLMTKLMRLAGCDIVGIAGFGARMGTTPAEVQANIAACLEPMGPIKPALPIPGGSDWAGTLPTVYAAIGHTDFGFIAGRGIFGHPMGPKAGAMSLRQAWDAVRAGRALADTAKNHPELAAAMKAFGN